MSDNWRDVWGDLSRAAYKRNTEARARFRAGLLAHFRKIKWRNVHFLHRKRPWQELFVEWLAARLGLYVNVIKAKKK